MANYGFAYDGNGNLTSDLNKDIGKAAAQGITYNFLNLPYTISVYDSTGGVKGTITYKYDAVGNKLEKRVTENTKPDRKTTYIGSFNYEDDQLQFIMHEEGRTRYAKKYFTSGDSAYQFIQDYFVKDHLGNVRVVLTEQQDTARYVATMEPAYRIKEDALFANVTQTAWPDSLVPGGYPVDTTLTNPNNYVSKVNGSGNKIGPSLTLKVMSGDTVDIAVKSFYRPNGSAGGNSNPLPDILASLASGIVSVAGEVHGTLTELSNTGTSPLLGPITSLLNSRDTSSTTKPRAWLNWILLDERFNYVSSYPQSGAIPVGNADELTTLAQTGINITKNGYLYIYVSNETQNWDVFFDNFSIGHRGSPLLEETHYYPFGLTMAGISSKAFEGVNYPENKKKYNGIEFNDALGLNAFDAQLRELDPQIGRWWQIDPKIEDMEMWSPYASNYNNPIRYSDPLGDEGQACCKELWEDIKDAVVETGKATYEHTVDGARFINTNLNPLTPVVEFVTGKNVESDFTEDKPRMTSAGPALVSVMLFAEKPLAKLAEGTATTTTERAVPQVTKNAAQGTAYEKVVTKELENTGHKKIAEQVTIKPNGTSGKVRLDNISLLNGKIVLTDAKSSETAGLTPNQKVGYPLLEKNGGVVVGKKGADQGYSAGTIIPPTKVVIKRPKIKNK